MKKTTFQKKFFWFLLITIIIISAYLFFNRFLESDIKETIESVGIFGPILFILSYTATVIFSPLIAGPFVIIGLTSFGLFKAFFYIYASNILGSVINFFLAKTFGRPLIKKISGEKSMQSIDAITERIGIKALILFRLLGIGTFDIVSYAAGFTTMKFIPYFLITCIFSIPRLAVVLYISDQANKQISSQSIHTLLWMIFGYIILASVAYLLYKKWQMVSTQKQKKYDTAQEI